jgi:hypothetical protein
MNMLKSRFVFVILVMVILLLSCKGEKPGSIMPDSNASAYVIDTSSQAGRSHTWFAFTKDGFKQVDFPSRALKVDFVPWTESIRVCDAAMAGNGSKGAFFLVNKLGMLTFTDGVIKLAREVSYFGNSTVDSLIVARDTPIFHHFTNDFFNSAADTAKMPRDTVMISFNPQTQFFYPALLKDDIQLPANAEVTSVAYSQNEWLFQIKQEEDEKSQLDYRAFTFFESDFDAASARSTAARGMLRAITQDEFRKSLESESYAAKAPARLKNLLPAIPNGVSFFLECRFQDVTPPKLFSVGVNTLAFVSPNSQVEVNGHAVIADTYAAALLEDGTVYFQGALTGYSIYKNNAVTVFKLPELPEGFVYGNCIISGGKFYASWEERRFYETARSGFVQVNLDALLYAEKK